MGFVKINNTFGFNFFLKLKLTNMKKITLFLFLLSISFSFGQVVLNENFDAGLSTPTGWSNTDLAAGGVWTFETGGEAPFFGAANDVLYSAAGFSGSYAMFNSDAYGNDSAPENAALISPAFDCSALTVIKLTFNHLILTEYGGEGYVEVYNGTSWVQVAVYDETTVPAPDYFTLGAVTIDVSAELAGVTNAQVRFRWVGDWSYYWTLDNVMVQQPTGSAPNPVTTPTPADGAVDVFVDPTNGDYLVAFDWSPATTGDAATSYDVYLGDAANNLNLLGNTPNDMVNITGMDYSTEYFWQIVAKNLAGEAVGSSTWSFTTEEDPLLSVDTNTLELFSIYPNPVNNNVTIKTTLNINAVEIINQLGQRVLLVNEANIVNNTINVSTLSNGIYFMNISAEGKKQTIKIVKE